MAIHVLRHARKADTEAGIGPAQLSALSVLIYGGPCTVGDLAAAEQVKRPTMSRTVSFLESAGLVEKKASESDGRSAIVHPTPKGRAILEQTRRLRLQRLSELVARLSPKEQEQVSRATELIERALDSDS